MENPAHHQHLTRFYTCIRDICNALGHRGILCRFKTTARPRCLLGTRLLGPDCTCLARDDPIQHEGIPQRIHDYETIVGLFNDMYSGVHELTVIEKIWGIILEVVAVAAELTGMDDEVMLELIIQDNKRLAAFQALAQSA